MTLEQQTKKTNITETNTQLQKRILNIYKAKDYQHM